MRIGAIGALLAVLAGCGARHAIDASLADCVPPGTVLVAGANVEQLRRTPLYGALPAGIAEQLKNVSELVVASNGTAMVIALRGRWTNPPAGSTPLSANVAVTGADDLVRAAAQQFRTGRTGAPDLMAFGATAAAGRQIWAVARGGTSLPFTGNLDNLNRLFRPAEYVTAGAEVGALVKFELAAHFRDERGAQQFEESSRALLSLAAAANRGQGEVAAMLKSAQVARDGRVARITVSAGADAAGKAIGEALAAR